MAGFQLLITCVILKSYGVASSAWTRRCSFPG